MSSSRVTDDTDTLVHHELEPDRIVPYQIGQGGDAQPQNDEAHTNPVFISDPDGSESVPIRAKTKTLTTPVYYSTLYGVQMVRTQAVETQEDGSAVIRTPQQEDLSADQQRPLRPKDIRFILIFSIISVFLFIPTGFPALILAFKSQQDFQKGLQSGNMEKTKKRVKLCERLILLSVVLGLLSYALIVAIVERHRNGNHDHRTSLHWIH